MNESSVLKSFTQLAASEDDFCLTPPKLTLLAYIILKQHIFAVRTLQKEVNFFFRFGSRTMFYNVTHVKCDTTQTNELHSSLYCSLNVF